MSFPEDIAIITGGGGSLGVSLSRFLLKHGAKIYLGDLDSDSVKKNCELLKKEFPSAFIHYGTCDVTDNDSFERLFEDCKMKFGSNPTILINNAGYFSERNWRNTLTVNLFGTINGTELALKHMGKDQGGSGGTVVNISSAAGLLESFTSPFYATSKSAVIHYTRCIGHKFHYEATGVKILSIAPGFLEEPMKFDGPPTDRAYNMRSAQFFQKTKGKMEIVSHDTVVEEMYNLMTQEKTGTIKLCVSKDSSRNVCIDPSLQPDFVIPQSQG